MLDAAAGTRDRGIQQHGKKSFVVDLTVAGTNVADLAGRGIANATATAKLQRLKKNGKRKGEALNRTFGDQASVTFRAKAKGTYRATCRWQGTDGATVEATSERIKKVKKVPASRR